MTVSVVINGHGNAKSLGFAHEDAAAKLVRLGFNPSTLEDVDTLKCLAAAFVYKCQQLQDSLTQEPGKPHPGRELAVAVTLMQQASMMAVAAVTAHLA